MSKLPKRLEGNSLVPLLDGVPLNNSAAAYTLYPRWREYDNHSHCMRPYRDIEAIGLSVRTPMYRMTDWTGWNASFNRPNLDTILATELYDHRNDSGMGAHTFDLFETENLAMVEEFKEVVLKLRVMLKQQFGTWPNWPEPRQYV